MQDLIAAPWLITLLAGMLLLAGVTTVLLAQRPAAAPSRAPAVQHLGLGALAEEAPHDEHWLRGWLGGVENHPRLELEHVREFSQSPNIVFAALVQVLAAEGHIEGIEGYGTVVVFSPQRFPMASGRPMRARVHGRGGCTVLEVTSDAPAPSTLADRQRECVQIHHLLSLLAHRLHVSARRGHASALTR